MMGKVHTARSFRHCITYCLEDKKLSRPGEVAYKDRAELLYANLCYGDKQELIHQFNQVRQLNFHLAKPVMHIFLSLPPGETLPNGKLVDIAVDCAKAMEFDKNQFLTILHKDTPQQHMHLVANRIGFDGQTTSDSFSYGRIADFCRTAEQKHALRQEPGPLRYRKNEQQLTIRQGVRLNRLRAAIQESLEYAFFSDFEQNMRERGYLVFQKQGIAFMDTKKVVFKGSDAGYPLHLINRTLDENKQQLPVWVIEHYEKRQKLEPVFEELISGLGLEDAIAHAQAIGNAFPQTKEKILLRAAEALTPQAIAQLPVHGQESFKDPDYHKRLLQFLRYWESSETTRKAHSRRERHTHSHRHRIRL